MYVCLFYVIFKITQRFIMKIVKLLLRFSSERFVWKNASANGPEPNYFKQKRNFDSIYFTYFYISGYLLRLTGRPCMLGYFSRELLQKIVFMFFLLEICLTDVLSEIWNRDPPIRKTHIFSCYFYLKIFLTISGSIYLKKYTFSCFTMAEFLDDMP